MDNPNCTTKSQSGQQPSARKYRRNTASRQHALRWLINSIQVWPNTIEAGLAPEIGREVFARWKFIRSSEDNLIYFADCRQNGIGEAEFLATRAAQEVKV